MKNNITSFKKKLPKIGPFVISETETYSEEENERLLFVAPSLYVNRVFGQKSNKPVAPDDCFLDLYSEAQWGTFFDKYDEARLSYDKIDDMFREQRQVIAIIRCISKCILKLDLGTPMHVCNIGKYKIIMYLEEYDDYLHRLQLQKQHKVMLEPRYKKYNLRALSKHERCVSIFCGYEYEVNGIKIPQYSDKLFNFYRPFIGRLVENWNTKGVRFWKRFILQVLSGNNKLKAAYLIQTLASVAQYPEVKINKDVVIVTKDNLIKNMFVEFFRDFVFGCHHCRRWTEPKTFKPKLIGPENLHNLTFIDCMSTDNTNIIEEYKMSKIWVDHWCTSNKYISREYIEYFSHYIFLSRYMKGFENFITYQVDDNLQNNHMIYKKAKLYSTKDVGNEFYSYMMSLQLANLSNQNLIPSEDTDEEYEETLCDENDETDELIEAHQQLLEISEECDKI